MVMGLYSSVFPLLKNFVLLFEMKEPLIHQLHEEQVKLFKEFLGCYVKPEVILLGTSSLKLKKLDIKTTGNLLKPERMFLGAKATKLIQSLSTRDHVVKTFLKQVEEAYTACGKTLQEKLALSNTFLKAVSAIHPDASGHSITLTFLQKLPNLAPNVLKEEETNTYDLEIRKYQTDDLPEFEDGTRIDHWWGKDDIRKRYPCLCKMVRSLLSCFHGPQVESSFNIMNDIIDNKSGRINIETYNAIQNIKYSLKACEKGAITFHNKKDFLHEGIDPKLVRNMRTSCKQYKLELEMKRSALEEKKKRLNVTTKTAMVTKRKAKELCAKAAKKARKTHQQCIARGSSIAKKN
ncbi:uncharacterized protein [Mytilus edulis]|uniref:uncharacterized protein isoform X1 n=1 Tax=Mytilus edulis TaxID=6550 RepID=UPI0039EF9E61